MYGNTNDPNFSHYEAGADHFVNLLYTFDLSGKLTGAIVNVPCPSQCSEHIRRLSGDYWHDFRVRLRKQHGNVYVLPQCAAAGDLSPRILHAKAAQERRFRLKYGEGDRKDMNERKDIAERLLVAFNEALSWASKDIQTHLPLGRIVKTIELERRFISEAEAPMNRSFLPNWKQSRLRPTMTQSRPGLIRGWCRAGTAPPYFASLRIAEDTDRSSPWRLRFASATWLLPTTV